VHLPRATRDVTFGLLCTFKNADNNLAELATKDLCFVVSSNSIRKPKTRTVPPNSNYIIVIIVHIFFYVISFYYHPLSTKWYNDSEAIREEKQAPASTLEQTLVW
jgi:hypothetical protein